MTLHDIQQLTARQQLAGRATAWPSAMWDACRVAALALLPALCMATGLLVHQVAFAVDQPYNETADAKAAIADALKLAKTQKKDVLVILGANWCKDCVELDRSLKGQSASLIQQHFVLVKVNVGQFDTNLDIANAYGNPIKKGIPAAVLLSPDNKVLYATHGGELADARQMSDQGIYQFFENVEKSTHVPGNSR